MQVNPLTLAHLFEKNIRYVVPLYQRPYVWTEDDQWQPLWEDIARLAGNLVGGKAPSRMHFLGASVQEKVDVRPRYVETRRLIDGQQRFTTLQILFVAFRDAVRALNIEKIGPALDQLIANTHALRESDEETYKVWPTNVDRLDFEGVMMAGSPKALRESLDVASTAKLGRPIPDGYLYFHDTITDWLKKGDGNATVRASALYGALRDNIRIVVIDLDQSDDAQVIFETLNARGTPLLAADLVKNSLLNELQLDGGDVEKAYAKHWRHFDEQGAYWRRLIGRGHTRRARIEHFLQHTLAVLRREEVPAAHLYTTYQDLAKSGVAGTPLDRLKEFQSYADIYRKLDDRTGSPRFSIFLERLQSMDIASATPLLMTLTRRLSKKPNALDEIAQDLESYLVRRLVCRLSTKGYNQLFVNLTKTVADISESEIVAALQAGLCKGTAEFDRWPNDEEFRQAWFNNPLYENLTRARLRMILEVLERALRTDLAETRIVPKDLTIEHVLPQTWETHWPLQVGESEVERKAKLHCISNLTLVNDKLNPTLSNAPWSDLVDGQGRIVLRGKRATIDEHNTLFLNKNLTSFENWGHSEIGLRTQALFDIAVSEWPRPNVGV